MTYYERTKVGSTYYQDVVVCNVIAIAAAGDALAEYLLFLLRFDENDSPVEANSVNNYAPVHAGLFPVEVVNPTLGASYVSFRGSTSLDFVNAASSLLTNRPHLRCVLDAVNVEMFGTEITIFALVNFRTGPSTDVVRGIIGNRNGNFGFQLNRETSGEISMRVGNIDGAASSVATSTGANVQLGENYYLIIARWRFTGTTRETDIWVKSTDAVRNITNVLSQVTSSTAARTTKYLGNITFDSQSGTATDTKNSRKAHYRAYNKWLDYATEIEPIAFEIDGPNNE
jgi:hypothetical protein